MKAQRSARGVALISALLIVALAVSLATLVGLRTSLRLRDAGNARALSQAVASARGAIDFGRWALRQDQLHDASSGTPVDSLGEAWAQALPAFPVEGGSVSGVAHDAQAGINLNNLGLGKGSPADLQTMQALLAQFHLDPGLANALRDWVDSDSTVSLPGGAEDPDYLSLPVAQRAANQALFDVDELVRVRGFTPATVAALRPYVSALPVHTPVNINTAPAPVIAALFQVSPEVAEALLKVRSLAPFVDPNDLLSRAPAAIRQRLGGASGAGSTGAATAVPSGQTGIVGAGGASGGFVAPQFGADWSVTSQYFQIDARASYGQVQYGLSALVRRETKSTAFFPTILWERRTLF